jgi:transposase InsO family protein
MSALAAVAALENVSLRQVRRWCAERRIPARKRYGRWHVTRRRLGHVIQREQNKKVFQAIYGHSARDKGAFVATLALRGIWYGRYWQTLRRNFPEQFRFLYCDYRHHPEAYRIADDPRAFLLVRIFFVTQKHGVLPVTALAKNLAVSKSALYRAMPGLAKELKRQFLHDPTAPTGRHPAKKRPKEFLNRDD